MVKLSTITEANARFASNSTHDKRSVCVFAGATSGIGASAMESMAVMLQRTPIFYVLGRSEARFASQRASLEKLNPGLKLVFLQCDVSLIYAIDTACKQIATAEQKVDYLYMSQGCFPLNVPQYTTEGLDKSIALKYHSRMRLTMKLLPLLRLSSQPRALSVNFGGKERRMCDDDLGLQNPRNFGPAASATHTTTMTTLAFEYLAENDQNITFMHSYPGLVNTDIFSALTAPESFGVLGKMLVTFIASLIFVIKGLFGMTAADCGARQAFF